jgi:hypothetical protein
VAIVPLSIDTTILLRNDPGQTLFIVAAVYVAMVAYRSGRPGASTMAGVLAGLATAIKYTSVLALVPALLAALQNGSRSHRLGKVAMALAGCLLAIALTNHFVWADFPNFLKQLSDQVAVWGPKTWPIERDPARLRTALLGQFGPGLVLLVLGAAYGCYSLAIGGARAWIFWSFPLLYSWLTMQRPTLFSRWVYPLLPFACVAGAAGLGLVGAALDQRQRLQHRIVQVGGHVRPFLGPGAGLPFEHEVAGDAQPPRAHHDHDRGDHEQEPGQWLQQVGGAPGQQASQTDDQQQDRCHDAQQGAAPPPGSGQAQHGIGQAAEDRVLVRWGLLIAFGREWRGLSFVQDREIDRTG